MNCKKENLKAPHHILFMHFGDNEIRGSETCFIELLNLLNQELFKPVIICNSAKLHRALTLKGFSPLLMKIPQITIEGPHTKIQIFNYLFKLIKLVSISKKNCIRLIYSNSGLTTQLGYVLSRFLKIPIICHIHVRYNKRYAWMWFIRFVDTAIFVSKTVKDELLMKVSFKGKTQVIHNGVDTEKRYCIVKRLQGERTKLGIESDHIVIGQVGSLIYIKGVDILIKAFADLRTRFKNIKLLLIGDGEQIDEYRQLACDLSVEKDIIFLGYVDNIHRYYQHVIDINVLASRTEALPLTLIEASACGLPNIASKVGGIPEVVTHGETGILFRPNCVDSLNDKISLLISDKELRVRLGMNGRKFASKFFNQQQYIKKIEKELLRLL